MLKMIKMHDYAHYSKNVMKLGEVIRVNPSNDEKVILDFLVSAKETVGDKLDTLGNSIAYMHWVLSEDAQEIVLFANSLVNNRHSNDDKTDELIRLCADELAYLISPKCAQFYIED